MDCPKCSSEMTKIDSLDELPAVPWDWYKYSNYLEVTKVYYCVDCGIILTFGKFKLILYYIKNIFIEIRSMLEF